MIYRSQFRHNPPYVITYQLLNTKPLFPHSQEIKGGSVRFFPVQMYNDNSYTSSHTVTQYLTCTRANQSLSKRDEKGRERERRWRGERERNLLRPFIYIPATCLIYRTHHHWFLPPSRSLLYKASIQTLDNSLCVCVCVCELEAMCVLCQRVDVKG